MSICTSTADTLGGSAGTPILLLQLGCSPRFTKQQALLVAFAASSQMSPTTIRSSTPLALPSPAPMPTVTKIASSGRSPRFCRLKASQPASLSMSDDPASSPLARKRGAIGATSGELVLALVLLPILETLLLMRLSG